MSEFVTTPLIGLSSDLQSPGSHQRTRGWISLRYLGATHDAPRVSVFVVSLMLIGPGGEAHEAEAPASTRDR
jgi:hypothetical protein